MRPPHPSVDADNEPLSTINVSAIVDVRQPMGSMSLSPSTSLCHGAYLQHTRKLSWAPRPVFT